MRKKRENRRPTRIAKAHVSGFGIRWQPVYQDGTVASSARLGINTDLTGYSTMRGALEAAIALREGE